MQGGGGHVTDLFGYHPELVRKGIFRGLDLGGFAALFWKLEAMRSEGPLPKIRWRASERIWKGAGGTAHGTRAVTMRLGPAASHEEALEVLLHELVHCSLPNRHHDELFCRRLIACAREAFDLALDTAELLALPAEQGCVAYAIDHALWAAMKASLGHVVWRVGPEGVALEPAPPETEAEIEARRAAARAARIATREAHARARLAAWERKLKAAKRIAAKWRTKVRYYERRQEAAKRRAP